ncbi:MAG TPA: hypothetical protein VNB49_10220, partial [Candidatus Dormibacteraeota bacterium]|nr:hypothetical protein [Candidatus Dormibacteraeota bacterium]
IQDGTAFFTAELTEHHPLGLLSLLQSPVCVHRGEGLPVTSFNCASETVDAFLANRNPWFGRKKREC